MDPIRYRRPSAALARRGGGGFTFIEVMVALAIIAALLVTLLFTTSHNLSITGRHEGLTVATMLAHRKLAEVRYDPTRELRDKKGAFEEPYGDYAFEIYKEDKTVPVSLVYVEVAEITVRVEGGGEAVTLKKYLPKRIRQDSGE